jgi:hypothetical protein
MPLAHMNFFIANIKLKTAIYSKSLNVQVFSNAFKRCWGSGSTIIVPDPEILRELDQIRIPPPFQIIFFRSNFSLQELFRFKSHKTAIIFCPNLLTLTLQLPLLYICPL